MKRRFLVLISLCCFFVCLKSLATEEPTKKTSPAVTKSNSTNAAVMVAPGNDNCANAVSLGTVITTTTTTGTNSAATSDQTSPSCFTYSKNVWYKFTVPAGGGSYSIVVNSGTLQYPDVVVFSGTCGSFTEVACNSECDGDGTETISNVSVSATCLAAGTYYISVDDDKATCGGAVGTFSLTVTQTVSGAGAPANNNCANAISLGAVSTTTTTTGNNNCATSDQTSPSCFTYAKNVWYKFTVPAGGGSYQISVANSGGTGTLQYPDVAVFSGTCGTFTELACNAECGGDFTETISSVTLEATCLAAGTYYISVDDDEATCGGSSGTFSITVTQTIAGNGAPANDNCTGAISVTVGNCVNGDVSCATQSQVGCLGTANDDIWYKFVATATTLEVNVSASASFDPVVQIFKGTCASLTSLYCDDADYTTGGSNQCQSFNGFTIGSTYYIRVYDYGSGVPSTTTFTMCVATSNAAAYTCNLNYTYSSIALNIEAGVSTAIPGLADDILSNAVPLGFTFCYDGYQYSQVYISSNAALVFDAVDPCSAPNVDQPRVAAANGIPTGYQINAPIPNTTDYTPQNAILGPWHDIDVSNGGTITYAILGTAPNRRFVVYFNGVHQFESASPCQNAGYAFTGQMKLYETSNNIEIHVQNQKSCTQWNNGQAILGLQNAFGTLAVVPTGYNANAASPYNQYSITNLAWRFVTPCTSCLAVLPLEIITFTAEEENSISNKINWVTASEDVISWFQLERSPDGQNFTTIAKIKSKNPQGSSYVFEDTLPDRNQTYYYRIATEDANGNYTYSGLRLVQRKDQATAFLNAYPNPFSRQLTIDIESSEDMPVQIDIHDNMGRTVYSNLRSLNKGSNTFTIDDMTNQSGLLLLRVTNLETGKTLSAKKVIKE